MVELHLGDCLEYMRTLPDGAFDAVVTDPPYGINATRSRGRSLASGWRDYRAHSHWDNERPCRAVFDEMRRVAKRLIIWGGNYFADWLPPSQQWLVWDKGQRQFSLADCELAWSSEDKAARIFTYSRAQVNLERVEHPTQKPLALMAWCLSLISSPGETVFDPFMGSGTTGVACVQTGRRFIGCEIDPGYFKIAQRRIELAQMQPPWCAIRRCNWRH